MKSCINYTGPEVFLRSKVAFPDLIVFLENFEGIFGLLWDKNGFKSRLNLRFRMNSGPKPNMTPCLFWLIRPFLGHI